MLIPNYYHNIYHNGKVLLISERRPGTDFSISTTFTRHYVLLCFSSLPLHYILLNMSKEPRNLLYTHKPSLDSDFLPIKQH